MASRVGSVAVGTIARQTTLLTSCCSCLLATSSSRTAFTSSNTILQSTSRSISTSKHHLTSRKTVSTGKARLNSLIALYHSNEDAPSFTSEQSLLEYVDAKLLNAVKVKPTDGNRLLREREILDKGDYYPEMHGERATLVDRDAFEDVLKKAEAAAEGSKTYPSHWRPLMETSSAESQRRGRAIIDALHGTVQVKNTDGSLESIKAGRDLAQELFEAQKLGAK